MFSVLISREIESLFDRASRINVGDPSGGVIKSSDSSRVPGVYT
jgi:hypothetical protein